MMETSTTKISFGVRNIDKDEWDLFKYNAAKYGYKSANDKMLDMISDFNEWCRSK